MYYGNMPYGSSHYGGQHNNIFFVSLNVATAVSATFLRNTYKLIGIGTEYTGSFMMTGLLVIRNATSTAVSIVSRSIGRRIRDDINSLAVVTKSLPKAFSFGTLTEARLLRGVSRYFSNTFSVVASFLLRILNQYKPSKIHAIKEIKSSIFSIDDDKPKSSLR